MGGCGEVQWVGVVRCSGCGPLTLALEVGDRDVELHLHILLSRWLVHKQLTYSGRERGSRVSIYTASFTCGGLNNCWIVAA